MDPAHTRRGQAQRLYVQGLPKCEIALRMGLHIATVKRYLIRENAREDRQPLDRQSVRGYRNRIEGPLDKIEDMIQYKDERGIVRWRMPDQPAIGNRTRKRPYGTAK